MIPSSPAVAGKTSPAHGVRAVGGKTNMKKHSLLMTLAMITFIALSLPSPAAAKDAVSAMVTNPLPASNWAALMADGNPIVNGNPDSPGTFAVGTIQLFYAADISELSSLDISFDLALGIKPSSTSKGQSTIYPATVEVAPVGSTHFLVDPNPYSWEFVGSDSKYWPAAQTFNLTLTNLDNVQVGDDLVANLRIGVTDNGHFLDTPTSVQIHVLVMDPPTACIQVFNFLTDLDFTTVLTGIDVNVSNSKKNGPEIKSTNPGQLSNNILVVSQCAEPQTFDLQITLDSHFEVQGHNAVATYLAGGYTDPSQFDISFFGNSTKQGQNLLLTGITLPPNSSFLATVHIGIISGGSTALLPVTGIFDGFVGELLVPGSNLTSLAPFIPFTMADPNPAMAELGFTIK
jgi:hypothetical protein